MKFFSLIILIVLSISCASEGNSSSNVKPKKTIIESTTSSDLSKAIALAIQNKDYRLLVTSGRSMSIPGVKGSDYQRMIELCGKKYNAATGDVLTSEEQRQARKKVVTYMRQYNEQMSVICQENNVAGQFNR